MSGEVDFYNFGGLAISEKKPTPVVVLPHDRHHQETGESYVPFGGISVLISDSRSTALSSNPDLERRSAQRSR